MSISTLRLLGSLALAFAVLFVAGKASADLFMSKNGNVTKGNKLLQEKKPAEALEAYDAAARALPDRPAVHLNRGLALSRMGAEQADKAMQAFQLASDGSAPSDVRARALGNLGNAFFKKEDYEKALDLYKQSLNLQPGNKDVAWNFELARNKKKEKDEQKKKDEEQKKNQDQQNQDQQKQNQQKQNQQNQDQQKQNQQKQDQQKQDQQKQDQQKQDQQKQQPNPEEQQGKQEQKQEPKTKQEVEQVLESLENEKDNVRKEMARQKGAMVPQGSFKDW